MTDESARPDESSLMGDVNVAPTGPSMPDEMEILREHLAYDESTGTFSGRVGDDD